MEESKNTKTNVVGIGHNNTYSKEQYERLLNRFHYVMGFTKSAIYDIQRLFDDALTGYINSSGYSNDKLKPFQIYDRRQRAKRNVNVIISSLNKAKEKLAESNKGTDTEAIKLDIESLNKIWATATEKMYQETSSTSDGADTSSPEGQSEENSEIKDADYEVVEDEKK